MYSFLLQISGLCLPLEKASLQIIYQVNSGWKMIKFYICLAEMNIQLLLMVRLLLFIICGEMIDWLDWSVFQLRGKRFTVCTEITIILGAVRFTIRGGHLWYNAHFFLKSCVELPFSPFGDHLINILRKVNRLIYAFEIN